MRFLVRLVVILTSQFLLWYEVGDDDRFSPVTGGRVPLLCPVDLDSLYMLLRNDAMNAESGPQAEVWDWRSVLHIQTARIGFVELEGHMFLI